MPAETPRETVWKCGRIPEEKTQTVIQATGLDMAINKPGPSHSAGQMIVVRSKRKFSNGSLSERACSPAIFGCPNQARVDQNQMVHCGQLLYTSLMLFLSKLYFPSQKPQDGRVWSNNVEIFTYSFVTADCMIHFNGSKSIPSVSNIIILLCSDEYLEILAFTN